MSNVFTVIGVVVAGLLAVKLLYSTITCAFAYVKGYRMALGLGSDFAPAMFTVIWASRRGLISTEACHNALEDLSAKKTFAEKIDFQNQILEEIESLTVYYTTKDRALSPDEIELERKLARDLIRAVSEGRIVLYFLTIHFCCI